MSDKKLDNKLNFFKHCRDLLCVLDIEGNFIEVNPAWKTVLGHEPADLIGKKYSEYVHPEDLVDSTQEYDEFKKDEYVQRNYRNRFRCLDGSYKWVEWNGEFVDGLSYACARECSKSQEDETRLNLTLSSSSIGMCDYNILTEVLVWDDRMYELFDVEKTMEDNALPVWEKRVHPEDLDTYIKVRDKAIKDKESYHSEFRVILKNGDIRYIDLNAHVFYDADGVAIRILGVNTDVTKKKELEIQSKKQQKIVEHQAKLASLGELSAAMGHEINNPLNILLGFTDVLKKQLDKGDTELKELYHSVNRQKEAALRIKNISDELRNFSRVESEDIQQINIHIVLKNALDFIIPLMDKSGVEFDVKYHLKIYMFRGTEGKIQQIIMNLLINAKDAVEHSDKKLIRLFSSHQNNEFTLFVKDSGEGIDESIKDKIFEPFYTSKQVGKGTGLGLSLSYSFASLLGGKIFLESTSTKGSCFGLTLEVTDIPRA